MSTDSSLRLARLAEVIVRVGLNLRSGQRLLVAEPFELQGVSRQTTALVEAVSESARAAGARGVEVIWGDEMGLRETASRWPDLAFDAQLARQAAIMREYVARGDALLFLQASDPRLMDGVAPALVAAFRQRCWEHYGTVAPDLVAAKTNWTVAPAPTANWARAVSPELAEADALERLWSVVAASCRLDAGDPIGAWRSHLDALTRHRDELDRRRLDLVRMRGDGVDLELRLARGHLWRTAVLATRDGRPFVANLPTEEVFTAPDCSTAEGVVRVARPLSYGGALLDGIELEFCRGRVVSARAREGGDLLRRILAIDEGAVRLGEIAWVPDRGNAIARAGGHFFHPLLDENALDHIALGDGYGFTVDATGARSLNHSLIHIDLPLALTAFL